jgi:hypothetical protein
MLLEPSRIIYLNERILGMVKKDVTYQNPIRILGRDADALLSKGHIGAIVARAGVGKTAFLIQVALDYLIREKNVLHVSLSDPVDKVSLWYKEVFRNITAKWSRGQSQECWEMLLPHRFIMTFRAENFAVPTLDERLTDLSEQGVFDPEVVVIDGFRFDDTSRNTLEALKNLIDDRSLRTWFTVRTHRHEKPGPNGIPAPLATVSELFEVIIKLQPDGSEIHVNAVKGGEGNAQPPKMFLDPATLLVKNAE